MHLEVGQAWIVIADKEYKEREAPEEWELEEACIVRITAINVANNTVDYNYVAVSQIIGTESCVETFEPLTRLAALANASHARLDGFEQLSELVGKDEAERIYAAVVE